MGESCSAKLFRLYCEAIPDATASSQGAACNANPVDGWRWVFRVMLMFAALLLIGFGALYHVSAI